ncbi:GntR family transcriptional regulator [Corynebacterium tapiri]|uniref:GntR family transcriptional regulator n=1 Tax=Corynebacterium tapiri TaxID=1448266 RepID=A0A5C4U6Z5_9CORY|nr:GntR family transcriptional regulator [Corynebacterium tapiri]TNM00534.1 GntR family transcriptional regulator [Corynebacterium tapiri]
MRARSTAHTLRRLISEGEFLPGAKLNEVVLAESLGVSRNTLREAFAMLAEERLVRRERNRGVFVASPSVEDIQDVYRARLSIEPAGLRFGSLLDARFLRNVVNSAQESAETGDLAAVALANQEFHRHIVAAHDSRWLNELMSRLLATMRLAFLDELVITPDFHVEYVEHNAKIARLVAEGQRDGAAGELEKQLRETLRTLSRQR